MRFWIIVANEVICCHGYRSVHWHKIPLNRRRTKGCLYICKSYLQCSSVILELDRKHLPFKGLYIGLMVFYVYWRGISYVSDIKGSGGTLNAKYDQFGDGHLYTCIK